MVSTTRPLAPDQASLSTLDALAVGLDASAKEQLERACQLIETHYADHRLGSGESVRTHALGMAQLLTDLKLDLETRLAALLFALHEYVKDADAYLATEFSPAVSKLVESLRRLKLLRLLAPTDTTKTPDTAAQAEILRKMLLAMSDDVRVVMLRLASRTQTLRHYTDTPNDPARFAVAREALDLYAPLANRLGIWQIKWELEDLSFRFLEPELYKRIAKMLDERRLERENFIQEAMKVLASELEANGIHAEIQGRPKHIYSIYNKMRAKHLSFDQVYDIRALRVLVNDVKDCYSALGVVHHIWQPIPKEFDDYISHPKGNNYRSLHTAVHGPGGLALEVQIRTYDMHRHAELGVAAHWRYKESSQTDASYDDKIAWLRQLLSWKEEISDSAQWVQQFKQAALDDTIYVLTPQGRVLDLPKGATPVDFAYRLHSELGHRCRGAKVDGALTQLNKPLETGQRIEIVTVKQGGPSRDWLNPELGYLVSNRARSKVRQWFAAQEEAEQISQGRALLAKELQRAGQTNANVYDLAHKLGHAQTNGLFLALSRDEVSARQIQLALRGPEPVDEAAPDIQARASRAPADESRVLIVGVGKLMTQLGRCCKPVPPDEIGGFVTRGKGVSVHRVACSNFRNMITRHPERMISAEWGGAPEIKSAGREAGGVYPVGILVESQDRHGLLRDLSEILSRDKINVTSVRTHSRSGLAMMEFTVEVKDAAQLSKTLHQISECPGVVRATRA